MNIAPAPVIRVYGPILDEGWCLHNEDLAKDRFRWWSFDAPLISGDVVALFVERRGAVQIAFKFLERTRDGRWWFKAWHTRDESSLIAYPVFDGSRIKLLAIGAIVKTIEIPRATPREPLPENPSQEFARELYEIGADAVAEWCREGYLPPAQMNFRNDPAKLARLPPYRHEEEEIC